MVFYDSDRRVTDPLPFGSSEVYLLNGSSGYDTVRDDLHRVKGVRET